MANPVPIPDWVAQEVGVLHLQIGLARRRIAELEAELGLRPVDELPDSEKGQKKLDDLDANNHRGAASGGEV